MSTLISHPKTDTELQADVLEAMRWDPGVDATHIGVAVKNCIVTLTGHVLSYEEKYAAEKVARRVHGVAAVADELDVKLPESSRRTDEDIAQAAVRGLKWNPLVPSGKIQVTVNSGWITLEGEVNWQFQRKAAERSVRHITGVMGVTNLITIRPRVSPEDLKERIEEAFTRNALIDADHITVEVDGGKVTLRGIVHSWAEMDEAVEQAWAAPSVTSVENLITVDAYR